MIDDDELALLNGLELGVEKEGTIVKGKENMVFSDSLYRGTTRVQLTAVLLLCMNPLFPSQAKPRYHYTNS